MIVKILFIAVAVTVRASQNHHHGHGHAHSSQSVILQSLEGHAPVLYQEQQYKQHAENVEQINIKTDALSLDRHHSKEQGNAYSSQSVVLQNGLEHTLKCHKEQHYGKHLDQHHTVTAGQNNQHSNGHAYSSQSTASHHGKKHVTAHLKKQHYEQLKNGLNQIVTVAENNDHGHNNGQTHSSQNIFLDHGHKHTPVHRVDQHHKELGTIAIVGQTHHHELGHTYSTQNVVLHHDEHVPVHHVDQHDVQHKENVKHHQIATVAQTQYHGHEHSHAYSSQNVVLHPDEHVPVHHVNQHHEQQNDNAEHHHIATISQNRHHGHDHGHAYSSQNVVLHSDEDVSVHYVDGHNEQLNENVDNHQIATVAQNQHHSHKHGNAYSSQNVVLHHDEHVPVHHVNQHDVQHKENVEHHQIATVAQNQHHGHEHGHAYLSQNVVLHPDVHVPEYHMNQHHEQHNENVDHHQIATVAQNRHHGHEHGHAYSSQNVVIQHNKHVPVHHVNQHHEQQNDNAEYHHIATISQNRHHDRDHGHAYSSQNVVLHNDEDVSVHYVDRHNEQLNENVENHQIATVAQNQHHGHEHGHAYSSQNVVLHHDEYVPEYHINQHHEQHNENVDHHQIATVAQNRHHGHEHGHAYSSQNVVIHHNEHEPVHHVNQHHEQQNDNAEHHHIATISQNRHHGHDHGHAYSSQNVVLHNDEDVSVHYVDGHNEQLNENVENHHLAPVVQNQHRGHDHSHAYSSQNVVLHHDEHVPVNNVNQHHESHKENVEYHQIARAAQNQHHGHAYSSNLKENDGLHHIATVTQNRHQGYAHGYAYQSQNLGLHNENELTPVYHQKQHHDPHNHQQHLGLAYGHAHSSQRVVFHDTHKKVQHAEQQLPFVKNYGHHHQSYGHLDNVYHDNIHQYGHASSLQTINQEQHVQLQKVGKHGHGHNKHSSHATTSQAHQERHASSSKSISVHEDGHRTKYVEYYGHPKYEFAYKVKDLHTHDIKSQHEQRDGDVVKGVYSLHQPDGVVRTVRYHSEHKSGFNADVKFEGHSKHIIPEHHHHH